MCYPLAWDAFLAMWVPCLDVTFLRRLLEPSLLSPSPVQPQHLPSRIMYSPVSSPVIEGASELGLGLV